MTRERRSGIRAAGRCPNTTKERILSIGVGGPQLRQNRRDILRLLRLRSRLVPRGRPSQYNTCTRIRQRPQTLLMYTIHPSTKRCRQPLMSLRALREVGILLRLLARRLPSRQAPTKRCVAATTKQPSLVPHPCRKCLVFIASRPSPRCTPCRGSPAVPRHLMRRAQVL